MRPRSNGAMGEGPENSGEEDPSLERGAPMCRVLPRQDDNERNVRFGALLYDGLIRSRIRSTAISARSTAATVFSLYIQVFARG